MSNQDIYIYIYFNGEIHNAFLPSGPGTLWELFLRIDTMVLSGMINSEEATHLRKVIVNSQISIHDAFHEIQHKKDIELLSELHHFSEKITRYIKYLCTCSSHLYALKLLIGYKLKTITVHFSFLLAT